MDKSQEIL